MQQHQPSTSRRTLGVLSAAGTLRSQPKAIPALLKTGKADFGEDYVDSQRRNRFARNGGGRARSEIAEVLSNVGNSRLNASYFQHRRETSYNEDDRHSLKAVRSASYYDRPRSSFEPAMRQSPTAAAPRIVRNRLDDWQEVERRHQYSTDEDFDDEELDSAESDQLREELEMYNTRRGHQPAGGYGARASSSYYVPSRQAQHRQEFSEDDICFFGMLKLTPQKARQFILMKEPPPEFWRLASVEKAAYLYYFSLYKQYINPVEKFHKIFNREFFKYTADGDSDDVALMKICKHTYDEYDLRRQRINKQAYDRSRDHLFSDGRATPDSRATSYCEQLDESDITSVDSGTKEPYRFAKPHALASFAVGGKLVILNPEYSISTVQIVDVKQKIRDRANVRNIQAMDLFKGPLIVGETPSHTPLLFIERQINNIRNSEIYRQNPLSSDANDVLLIWRLLEVLVRQHGNVTGPDLARLLTENYSFSSPLKPVRGRSDKEFFQAPNGHGTDSPMFAAKDERRVDQRAMDRFTQFLLGGYIDEAIESATSDGLFFDALILAHRMFGNDRQKMEQIESKLLSYRDPQHPSFTLLSVASQMPVPILSNMSAADDTSSWRAHIAIVLANLNNDTAMYTVQQLGLALSRKEFNAAADFCFLAVNLLTQHDCFAPVDASEQSEDEESFRRHITLINASLPDDEYCSTKTRHGWSIVDFQATEIYDFALKMSQRPISGGLTASSEYQKCRLEYAQMLAEYGGAATSAFKYCTSIATCIWDKAYQQSAGMLNDLCDLADRLHCAANQTTAELQWVPHFRHVQQSLTPLQASKELLSEAPPQHSSLDSELQLSPSSYQPTPPQQLLSAAPPQHSSHDFELQMSSSSYQPTAPQQLLSEAPPQHSSHNFELQLSSSSYQSTPPPQQTQRTESEQFGDSIQSRQLQPEPYENPLVIPSQDFSAFSQPSAIPEHISESHQQHVDEQSPPQLQQPQQIQQPQVQKQQPEKKQEESGGLFGGLRKLAKYIPTGNEMKLPDDSKSNIQWDEKLGRWVGGGIKEPVNVLPPPIMNSSSNVATPAVAPSGPIPAQNQPQNPATDAAKSNLRRSGASRYSSAGTIANSPVSSTDASTVQEFAMPPPQLTPTFSFMPILPDDIEINGEEVANPFNYPTQPDSSANN